MSFGQKRIPKHLIIYDQQPARRRQQSGKRWMIFTFLLFASGLLLALHTRAANASPDQGRTLNQTQTEQGSGELTFNRKNGERISAEHMYTEVDANINGLVAHVTYTQHFRNQSSDWLEAVYSFPLSEKAGINHMEMRIGERVIVGEIKEKQEAKRIYNAAVKAGKRAALTEQQRPNLFTQKVANIGPGEDIVVTLKYLQRVDFMNTQFEWRLPTTFTPRYIPGSPLLHKQASQPQADDKIEDQIKLTAPTNKHAVYTNSFGWAHATDEVPDAHSITPPMSSASGQGGNRFQISIQLNSGLPLSNIDALYHDVQVSKNKQAHRITLQNGEDTMDRDFVLQWTPIASKLPSTALFSEKVDGEFYSLLMVIPPNDSQPAQLARDIIFIVDTSGSMQGPSISQAKSSLSNALNELTHLDRFNIIEFNSTHSTVFENVRPATQANITQAENWVSRLNANGGTEMRSALNEAFNQMPNDKRLQQIVFITDGAVGNESALFKVIHDKLKNSRLFTVGIGAAPNSYFMRKAAEFGRGDFLHIGHVDEVQTTMSALFEKLNSAISTNINVQWPQNAEQYPQRIGELYKGEALLVTARTNRALESVSISGELQQRAWHRVLKNRSNNLHEGIGTLWAREKIEHIEDEKTTGAISDEQSKQQILRVALTHKLISRFTSFVATEKERVRPQQQALKTKAIANNIAKGQTFQAQNLQPVMLPNTATTGEIAWWLGLFGFVGFIVVQRMTKDEQ